MKHEDRPFDETEHEPKEGSFENFLISHNNNEWRVTGMLGFFGWNKEKHPNTFLVTEIVPERIVTGKQIGRASCRERVCLYV